jgi:protease IV
MKYINILNLLAFAIIMGCISALQFPKLNSWTPSATVKTITTEIEEPTSTEISTVKPPSFVPFSRGIVEYAGNTDVERQPGVPRWATDAGPNFLNSTDSQKFRTRFNLWRQLPWKKIKGKVVLNVKLGGSLSLESSLQQGFSFLRAPSDPISISSLTDFQTLMSFASHDPRVLAVLLQVEGLQCGYAKLQEAKRSINYFQQTGKRVIAYAQVGAEKETYLALACDEFYIPPEGGLDLRGFSAAATFVRGIFDKIGIEPQVQRIGKYKSFGDTFNRTEISDAQREVVSSLLMEASEFWADSMAQRLHKSADEIKALWEDIKVKGPYDFKALGYVTGVKYLDQVEKELGHQYREKISLNPIQQILTQFQPDSTDSTELKSDEFYFLREYDLEDDFEKNPRRNLSFVPGHSTKKSNSSRYRYPSLLASGIYLKKMRKGGRILQSLRTKEVPRGPRIAVINAVGGIQSGRSSNGAMGKSLGSETLIEMVKKARMDRNIKAVVLRIDSPGGSALASDLMWREIRLLSNEKPVIASMVDVAASGGYYIAMACDQIVAEELTITGSIGVVTSKFNAEKLNEKIGFKVETLSRGRFAEVGKL